jgi:hypothetical protein
VQIEAFGSTPFVWHGNKAITGNPFGKDAERLPNKPHGLNTFANIDNAVFLSSLNPPTKALEERTAISIFNDYAGAEESNRRVLARTKRSLGPLLAGLATAMAGPVIAHTFAQRTQKHVRVELVHALRRWAITAHSNRVRCRK